MEISVEVTEVELKLIELSTHVEQHRLDFANALVESIEGSLDGLKDSLILLQRHQALLDEFTEGSLAGLMTLELRVQQCVRVHQREDGVSDFLVTEMKIEKEEKVSKVFCSHAHHSAGNYRNFPIGTVTRFVFSSRARHSSLGNRNLNLLIFPHM